MPDRAAVERIWRGDDAVARLARGLLAPAEAAYRALTAARGSLYDLGVLASREPRLPAISIGNLSVGGTGKTPVAAWTAARLRELGARPAIVLRGYGGDEPLVHERLNPGVPVIVNADRVEGIARAASVGADVAVLDDAFQHRRVRRVADVVLVSADAWATRRRLLPAGPWREPLSSLRRASLALVTRKAATAGDALAVERAVHAAAPGVEVATAHLVLDELRRVDGSDRLPLSAVAGRELLAISAIGNAAAFARQLEGAGARVRAASFPDHHRFGQADAAALAARLRPGALAVCTLKDAVKLADLWPRAAPTLWYVSQHVVVERGGGALEALLEALLRARHAKPSAPARAGP